MSPDEGKLKFYAYDNLGFMAIKGKTGYWLYKEIDVFHSSQFGFDFDPSNLGELLKFIRLLKN
ncbi:MAG: hypothetical protein AB8B80_11690 [Marinicellaceae bacterium]